MPILRQCTACRQGPGGPIFAAARGPRRVEHRRLGHTVPEMRVARRRSAPPCCCSPRRPRPLAACPLPTRLAQALAVPSATRRPTSGAIAVDLTTGQRSSSRATPTCRSRRRRTRSCRSPTPRCASSGPSYRFRTEVLGGGRQVGTTWQGDLVLKGFGDPTLTSSGSGRLAVAARSAQGIARVDRASRSATSPGSTRGEPRPAGSRRSSSTSPRRSRRSSSTAASTTATSPPQPALAAAGRFRSPAAARDHHAAAVGGRPGAGGAVALAQIDSAPLLADPRGHGPRERQLHRRDAAEGDRRRVEAAAARRPPARRS